MQGRCVAKSKVSKARENTPSVAWVQGALPPNCPSQRPMCYPFQTTSMSTPENLDLPVATPAWAERLVRMLDDGLRIPGTQLRFGLDGLLGFLLPELGDLIGAVCSLSLVWLALKQRVPARILGRMLLNIAIDALVGAIPVLGDLFDLTFKANRRNLNLLEAHRSGVATPIRPVAYLWLGLAMLLAVCSIAVPIAVSVMLVRWLMS